MARARRHSLSLQILREAHEAANRVAKTVAPSLHRVQHSASDDVEKQMVGLMKALSPSWRVERITKAGHHVVARLIEQDDAVSIEQRLRVWIADPLIDVVITNGGTGVTGRDTRHPARDSSRRPRDHDRVPPPST